MIYIPNVDNRYLLEILILIKIYIIYSDTFDSGLIFPSNIRFFGHCSRLPNNMNLIKVINIISKQSQLKNYNSVIIDKNTYLIML